VLRLWGVDFGTAGPDANLLEELHRAGSSKAGIARRLADRPALVKRVA